MNAVIRIAQVLLALFALNGIYGLATQLSLSPLSSGQKPSTWDITGSVITALLSGFIIFLLQRYYEIRNKSLSNIGPKRFLGIALKGASIAALIGVSIVMAIMILALMNL